MAEETVLVQLEHLQTYPSSAAALERKALSLHGWVHDFETEQVFGDRSQDGQFVPIERNKLHSSIGPPEVTVWKPRSSRTDRRWPPRDVFDFRFEDAAHSLIQLLHLWNGPCN